MGMSSGHFTIGELAARLGVPVSTIRYYERQKLMPPAGRTASNYRLYTPDLVARLQFIRAAQASGLTLADIRTVLDWRDGGQFSCREVQGLLESRLKKIREQIREFRQIEAVLASYLAVCHQAGTENPCPVIDHLDSHSTVEDWGK